MIQTELPSFQPISSSSTAISPARSVLDAFSKIRVTQSLLGGQVKVTKQEADADSVGISNVIRAGNAAPATRHGRGYIDTARPRVIVATLSRELGQLRRLLVGYNEIESLAGLVQCHGGLQSHHLHRHHSRRAHPGVAR